MNEAFKTENWTSTEKIKSERRFLITEKTRNELSTVANTFDYEFIKMFISSSITDTSSICSREE